MKKIKNVDLVYSVLPEILDIDVRDPTNLQLEVRRAERAEEEVGWDNGSESSLDLDDSLPRLPLLEPAAPHQTDVILLVVPAEEPGHSICAEFNVATSNRSKGELRMVILLQKFIKLVFSQILKGSDVVP